MRNEALLAADLQECASRMIKAAEGQQVILQHTQRFFHMQPMQVHLRGTISIFIQAKKARPPQACGCTTRRQRQRHQSCLHTEQTPSMHRWHIYDMHHAQRLIRKGDEAEKCTEAKYVSIESLRDERPHLPAIEQLPVEAIIGGFIGA